MEPVLCVCCTTYPARAAMLCEALHAYDLQTYSPRRMLVINDGSPLRSVRSDVTVVNLPGQATIGAKRQLGLELARHEWVATWDDDDFCLPNHLASLIATAVRAGARYVRSSAYALADQDFRVGGVVRRPCYGSALVWAPSARQAGGYTGHSYGEDWALYTKLAVKECPMGLCSVCTYVCRRHLGNVTTAHEDAPWGLSRQLRESLEDQRRWPDLSIDALQAGLDELRTRQRGCLVVPV